MKLKSLVVSVEQYINEIKERDREVKTVREARSQEARLHKRKRKKNGGKGHEVMRKGEGI